MKFTKLEINNFLTIKTAEMELDDRGLLLIQGENRDDTSADSNGAGKSSVVDALCWALYGTTARGVSTDAVVNRTAKKDCVVAVTVQDNDADDFSYVIKRYRKHATEKNALKVSRVDNGGNVTDMTKGTDKETQEVVNQIVGCSHEVFVAAVYAGQEAMPDLPGMTDKMLKTLIEESAGVEVLAQAYQVARDKHGNFSRQVDLVKAQWDDVRRQRERCADELTRLGNESNLFESGRRDRAKAEMARALPVKENIERVSAELASLDVEPLKTELEECAKTISAHNATKAELSKLVAASNAAQRQVVDLTARLQAGKDELTRAEAGITSLDSQVGQPCGECGKAYCEHDLEGAKKARLDGIAKIKERLRPMVEEICTARVTAETAYNAAQAFEKAMPDISAVSARSTVLSAEINRIERLKHSVAVLNKDFDAIKTAAQAKLTETNPWTKAIEAQTAASAALVASDGDLAIKHSELVEELEVLADAVKVFGPAGVRAHVLDTVTPYLNDRTKDYLGALADGNIHATWSTLSKTAKGELREKFNIEVTNDKGADSFAGLSGGEKRKVRIACAMALQDMVASRATKPIGIFIADEVDHALDESGLERLMGVLERKARERGTVLVISHNSLADWCDQIVNVAKTGGYSVVSGSNVRDSAFV